MNDTTSTAANALLAKVAVNRKVMADPAVVAAIAARDAAAEVLEQAIGEGGIRTLALSSPTEPPMAASAREFEDAARKTDGLTLFLTDLDRSKVEIRPMMYLALSYDQRNVDGREAVTFLVKVKENLEDPQRLLLDI